MTETETVEEDAPQKASPVKTLLLNAVGAVMLGAIAVIVVFVFPTNDPQCLVEGGEIGYGKKKTTSYQDIAFVNLEPLVVTLGPAARSDYLKVSISLETTPSGVSAIEHLNPRLRDLLNSYLRSVDESDLTEPAAMTRLRAHLLRRLQVATPPGTVSDVLITDFILN